MLANLKNKLETGDQVLSVSMFALDPMRIKQTNKNQ